MRTVRAFPIASALALILGLVGCGEDTASVDFDWAIFVDTIDNVRTCEEVGASEVRVEAVPSGGGDLVVAEAPCESDGLTVELALDTWDLEITLRDPDGAVVGDPSVWTDEALDDPSTFYGYGALFDFSEPAE